MLFQELNVAPRAEFTQPDLSWQAHATLSFDRCIFEYTSDFRLKIEPGLVASPHGEEIPASLTAAGLARQRQVVPFEVSALALELRRVRDVGRVFLIPIRDCLAVRAGAL